MPEDVDGLRARLRGVRGMVDRLLTEADLAWRAALADTPPTAPAWERYHERFVVTVAP